MKIRELVLVLTMVATLGCTQIAVPREMPPEPERSSLLQALIARLKSPEFSPRAGETLYPFTYTFRRASGEEIVRNGRGFVLLHGPLWCLVERWEDRATGKPGELMLLVDRNGRNLEAEVRRWPAGSRERGPYEWTCIRSADDGEPNYVCDYSFPEGTTQASQPSGPGKFYGTCRWNGDGLLEELTRFSEASMVFTYEGPKVTRIEFQRRGTMVTFMDFSYQ